MKYRIYIDPSIGIGEKTFTEAWNSNEASVNAASIGQVTEALPKDDYPLGIFNLDPDTVNKILIELIPVAVGFSLVKCEELVRAALNWMIAGHEEVEEAVQPEYDISWIRQHDGAMLMVVKPNENL